MKLPMKNGTLKDRLEKEVTVFSWMHPVAAFLLLFVFVPMGILCSVIFAAMVISAPMLLSANCFHLNAVFMLSVFC